MVLFWEISVDSSDEYVRIVSFTSSKQHVSLRKHCKVVLKNRTATNAVYQRSKQNSVAFVTLWFVIFTRCSIFLKSCFSYMACCPTLIHAGWIFLVHTILNITIHHLSGF